MKKRLLNLFLIIIFISEIYSFANKYESSALSEKEEMAQEESKPPKEGKTKDSEKINLKNETPQEDNVPEKYYGVYEITEFLPTLSFLRGLKYDRIREQEADMMLGNIVEIQEKSLVTYECFRWKGVYEGQKTRRENYRIEKVSDENPQYEWDTVDSVSTSMEEFTDRLDDSPPCVEGLEDSEKKICGRITVMVDTDYAQEFYVMENDMIMFSAITGEYFYLKKLDKEPNKLMLTKELSEDEKEKIMQEVYGNYTITEFLPTKFYPALDSGGDILLPQEEADRMIGREIVINKQLFTTYDNGRLPNSEAANRSMQEFLLEKIEIITPDYRIERKPRENIFGLRDDMLTEKITQEEYIEINVYPGYGESIFDEVLPQMYLLNDGRLLLYAMGEYFLLEKNSSKNCFAILVE